MPAVNSRNVVTRHYDSGLYHQCPVCQYAIDQDHGDALEVRKFIEGFELVEVVEPLDTDLVSEADPNETLPPR